MSNEPNAVSRTVLSAFDVAVNVSGEAVRRHIDQTRRSHPDASPKEVCDRLTRRYLAAVASTGAATGAVAAVPGIGTAASLALAGGDLVGFLAASGLLALSFAEIHGVSVDDIERRRMLVMGILLGDAGSATVTKVAGRTGAYWGKKLVAGIPVSTLKQANKVLGRNFVTKYGTKQGILVLGKSVPFGVGAAIGCGGNLGFGYLTVRAAHRAFGPAPKDWSESGIEVTVIPFPNRDSHPSRDKAEAA